MHQRDSRRSFLKAGAASALGAAAAWSRSSAMAHGYRSAGERPVFGFIGAGIRYETLVRDAAAFGPCAAICDVDAARLRHGRAKLDEVYAAAGLSAPDPMLCEDYRAVLDRSDIDVVAISTPDHWHVKIAIEAMQAGKDVYCEKPLTLTIEEGQKVQAAEKATGRVVQVGTQQRSGRQFQQAVAMLRSGRVGKPKRLTCAIGASPTSEAMPVAAPPAELNWNRWLGPMPYVPYRESPTPFADGYGKEFLPSRCHVHFRWWYDYAGGKLTDWGAHHVDIAMWALRKSDGKVGPYTIDPLRFTHPVEFKDGYPVVDDRFNVATDFHLRFTFADGMELDVLDWSEELRFGNGIMFQGESGRYFVNRGKLTGKPVEELATKPLTQSELDDVYPGAGHGAEADDSSSVTGHMQNFLDCVKSRGKTISDTASHHRHLTACHAANIAMRLGRKLTFDPATERFVGDDLANTFLARPMRKGFEF